MRTQSKRPTSSPMDVKRDSSNIFYVPVTITATGVPSIPSYEQTLRVNSDRKIVWTCDQDFDVWFKDRLVPAASKSKHTNGAKFAMELDASQIPYRNLEYEYVIDTDGGRLDPKVIVNK